MLLLPGKSRGRLIDFSMLHRFSGSVLRGRGVTGTAVGVTKASRS